MKKIIDFLEIHFNSVIFITLFMSMVIQVFMRYVLDMPSPFLHELMMYTFVWTVYLSSALAHRYRSHIRFNIIYDMFPEKVKVLIDLVFDVFVSFLFIYSFIPVVKELLSYNFIKSPIMNVSWTYLFMIFPIFMVLVVIHNAKFIYHEIRFLLKGERIPKEEKPWD